MNGHSCKICMKLHTQNVSPRIMPCGHSVCTECLISILGDSCSRCCPVCRESLPHSDFNQYKINYALMDACEEFSNSPWNKEALRLRLESLIKKCKETLTTAKEFASNCMLILQNISLMEANQSVLFELIGKDEEELNGKEENDTLDDIEKLIFDVESLIASKNSRTLCHKISYRLIEFQSAESFLTKIYNEVGKGERIETLCSISGETKSSKISTHNNTLLVHCFRSLSKDDQAKRIKFDDLKNVFLSFPILVFFNLTYTDSELSHRIFIRNFSQSVLNAMFFKLCTGESGPSYLDSTFSILREEQSEETGTHRSSTTLYNAGQTSLFSAPLKQVKKPARGCTFKESISSVNNRLEVSIPKIYLKGESLQQPIVWDDRYFDYISRMSNKDSTVEAATYYFALKTNGSFEISDSKRSLQQSNIIGTVIDDADMLCKKFENTTKGKVVDCGIAVIL